MGDTYSPILWDCPAQHRLELPTCSGRILMFKASPDLPQTSSHFSRWLWNRTQLRQSANICLELGKEIMAGSCFGHHHRNLLIHRLLFTTNPGGIPVLLGLPNSPSPDNTPMMDGLGYASTWPKHILQSQIFLSVQNKLACQKLQTHNSNLLTLVKDRDREQSVSLDSQVSCVALSAVCNYPSIPLWTPR